MSTELTVNDSAANRVNLDRDNRMMARALLLIIEKSSCATGDLVGAVEVIVKTLPAHYLRRIITVAQKKLDSLR